MAQASYDILIVGGGQAARRAAEGARAVAPAASIAILGDEDCPPYERPPLSKAVLETGDFSTCEVRTPQSYRTDRIDLLMSHRARSVDRSARVVMTEDGDRVGYAKLILATGSRAKTINTPKAPSDRVLVLRTRADAARIAPALTKGARVAIIGAGFIGLEVASSALARGATVIILEAASHALGRALPQEVGERLVAIHRAAGVEVRFNVTVVGLSATPDGAVAVATDSGVVEVDVVIVGIGVRPNTELAEACGLEVDDGVIVGADGSTIDPCVFAAGEVTRHPVLGSDGRLRLESWQTAELQAEVAGRSAAGQRAIHDAMPWFWSDQLGHNLQVLGHVPKQATLVRRDQPDGGAVWFAMGPDNRLDGVISLDAGREIAVSRRLLAKDVRLPAEILSDASKPLRQFLG